MASLTASFSIEEDGDVTGEHWHGVFTTKLRLSHADQFRRDEIRRKILGANPESASPRAANAAAVFSEIMIHLTSAPSWWKDNDGGLDLEDDNVVAKVFEGIMAEKSKYIEATKKKGEEAAAALKKVDTSTSK